MVFENIRNLREDNDIIQNELAEYLNVKQTTYSKYELGKINVPVEVLIKLADYYDVSIDYLVSGSTTSPVPYSDVILNIDHFLEQQQKDVLKFRHYLKEVYYVSENEGNEE